MERLHFNEVIKDPTNISNVQVKSYEVKELPDRPVVEYTATTRESLLMGPGGAIKLESIWDGDRMFTVIIKGGRKELNQDDIRITNIDSLGELRNKVNKDQLIICDDSLNSFCIVNFYDVREFGVAYYNYGPPQAFQYSGDGTLLYWGIGMRIMCLDTCEYEVLVNDSLSSVFFDLCYDSSRNYICVICELDLYCYYMGKQIWKRGVSDIIVGHKVIDGKIISILCYDGLRFEYFMQDGKLAE